jgi:membrane protease YdiL (CAAX protease family)
MATLPAEEVFVPIQIENRRLRILELLLVLAVAFSGPLYRSLFSFFGNTQAAGSYSNNEAVGYLIVCELLAILLLKYVLFRQGRSWKSVFGELRKKDVLVAVGLFVTCILTSQVVYQIIQKTAFSISGHFLSPRDVNKMLGLRVSVLTIFFVFLNPLYEELIVRGFLMSEIIDLTSKPILAVLISVGLQTAYHLYQGGLNATIVATSFVIMSLYFAKTRRLAPVVLLHFLMDACALGFHR